jgi:hypothetical protein
MQPNLMSNSIHSYKQKGSIASVRVRDWIARLHALRPLSWFPFFSDSSVCYVTVDGCCARNNFFTVPGITNAMEVRCVSLNPVPHPFLHGRHNGMPDGLLLREHQRNCSACSGCVGTRARIRASEREAHRAR